MRLTRSDWLFALLLCVGLQAAWVAQNWTDLVALHLPDTDDMMRLQQIRDWLGGQSWWDVSQHRLGPPPGLPMHWTRVNDLIPALIIVVVKPFAGAHGAELAAVLLYPALLFYAFLMLSARAAQALGGPGAMPDVPKIAILVAALAFPATAMFIPGRIDHHALQIVLLLGAVTGVLAGSAPPYPGEGRDPDPRVNADDTHAARRRPAPEHKTAGIGGVVTGSACVLSIVVGLETVPQIVALVCALGLVTRGGRVNLLFVRNALGGGLLINAIAMFIFMRLGSTTRYWDNYSNDLAMLMSPSLIALMMFVTPTPGRFGNRAFRWGYAALAVGFWLVTLLIHPGWRLGPYGQVDPFLMRVWMAHVGEARGVLHQASLATIWGYGALVVIALGVALYRIVLLRRQEPRAVRDTGLLPAQEHVQKQEHAQKQAHGSGYIIIAAPLAMSVLVMLFQLRGAYIGAGLAAPILAVWLAGLRARGGVALIGGALLSAGIVQHVMAERIGALISRPVAHGATTAGGGLGKASDGGDCSDAATMARLNRLPEGAIMALMDAGAYIIGATPHRVFAAPYHRNNSGNLAMYRFFMSPPDAARAQARQLGVRYVLFCADDFAELADEPLHANALVTQLKSGHVPAWLSPVVPMQGGAQVFEVRGQ